MNTDEEQDPAQLIAARLGLDHIEQADLLLDLCRWVDHQRAIATFGYPRDNHIPPPLAERLRDPGYLEALHEAITQEIALSSGAEDEGEDDPQQWEEQTLRALQREAARLRGGER